MGPSAPRAICRLDSGSARRISAASQVAALRRHSCQSRSLVQGEKSPRIELEPTTVTDSSAELGPVLSYSPREPIPGERTGSVDPLGVPLPHGTEVTTRVERLS